MMMTDDERTLFAVSDVTTCDCKQTSCLLQI